MTRLGPVCITPPRATLHTAGRWGIGVTLGVENISDGLSPLNRGSYNDKEGNERVD